MLTCTTGIDDGELCLYHVTYPVFRSTEYLVKPIWSKVTNPIPGKGTEIFNLFIL